MISVLLPVHGGADSAHFDQALDSLFNQDMQDFQVLLLVDGPVGKSLMDTIERWRSLFGSDRFIVCSFERNRGLGPVLGDGLKKATGKYVARMDADDISEPDRFRLQVEFLRSHPGIGVVGSNMLEFLDAPDNIVSEKKMPEQHEDILRYAALRNPINHPTAMFRREIVVDCGGYRDVPYFEDYDLWVRLIVAGVRLHNLPDAVLRYRLSDGFFERRRGIRYLRHQLRFIRIARGEGFITLPGVIRWLLLRNLPFLLPGPLQRAFYKKLRAPSI